MAWGDAGRTVVYDVELIVRSQIRAVHASQDSQRLEAVPFTT
jgi:hypothetical protein